MEWHKLGACLMVTMGATTAPTFQVEFVSECWDEAIPLFGRHFAEMPHRDPTRFHPDRATYERLESMGNLRFYTVRAGRDLVGYGACIFGPSLWYQGEQEVTYHSFYLEPAYRAGWTGLKFLQFIEAELDLANPVNRHLHAHLGRRESLLFRKLGYVLVHEEWEKPRKE